LYAVDDTIITHREEVFAMSDNPRAGLETRRGSFTTWFTFLIGIPLGVGVLTLIDSGPWQNETIQRYVHHEAEQAVVVLFFCCLSAFLAKLWCAATERMAHAQTLLPSWDGKAIPAGEVVQLQQSLNLVWDSVKSTYLGRRIANILNFVASRGSADDQDDQMRTLSDNDAIAVDGSYAITRFLIWAMPILGFLGTVLGITDAIGNIDPKKLETGGADNVTAGLTKAFDATALALGLTLFAMFLNSLLEKLEHGLLERVDQHVDEQLAHRFVRAQAQPTSDLPALSPALQQMMEKQAGLLAQATPHMAKAIEQAVETALTRFGQRIVDAEKKLIDRQNAVIEGLTRLVATVKENGREHQMAVARLTDAIGLSVEALAKARADEAQLLRLQEILSQNLALLANSATFEQAVESLTAAIHLLTTRVNPAPTPLRIAPTKHNAA
jgi:biopolymer transport protein ExbB/TolQ